MDKERSQILMLLDLCAFVYSQDPGKKSLRDLMAACRLAERHALPEAESYRDFLRRFGVKMTHKTGPDIDELSTRSLGSLPA